MKKKLLRISVYIYIPKKNWNHSPLTFIADHFPNQRLNKHRIASKTTFENSCSPYLVIFNTIFFQNIRCPDGYYFGDLREDQAPYINSYWPHAFTDSVKFVRDQLVLNGGLGK